MEKIDFKNEIFLLIQNKISYEVRASAEKEYELFLEEMILESNGKNEEELFYIFISMFLKTYFFDYNNIKMEVFGFLKDYNVGIIEITNTAYSDRKIEINEKEFYEGIEEEEEIVDLKEKIKNLEKNTLKLIKKEGAINDSINTK